jgi:hypothetical protein
MNAATCPLSGAGRLMKQTAAAMVESAGAVAKHATTLGYSVSIGSLFVQAIPFIDAHSWIVGLFGIFLTWITNVVFKIIDRAGKRRKHD